MAEIRLENLTRRFGDVVAVNDISVTFPTSTVTCLLGPSGCGKTTLMRMIAGLEVPTSGEIYFGSEQVTDLSPSQRNIGMVFQYPVVYRGMSVYRNVELPLRQDRSLNNKTRKERVDSVLESLDLYDVRNADVTHLGNGIRQKVAVAREVARRPRIILFDEPITNVDINAKFQLKRALKQLVKQHNQTIVYVTHDQTEAMTLADEIALMRDGKIVQRGTPRELYNTPNERFGGWFLGNPGMNFIECDVAEQDGAPHLVDPIFPTPVRAPGVGNSRKVIVGIRPERVRIHATEQPNTVTGHLIRSALVVGGQHLLTLQTGDEILRAKVPHHQPIAANAEIFVECPLEHVAVFDENEVRIDTELAYGTAQVAGD